MPDNQQENDQLLSSDLDKEGKEGLPVITEKELAITVAIRDAEKPFSWQKVAEQAGLGPESTGIYGYRKSLELKSVIYCSPDGSVDVIPWRVMVGNKNQKEPFRVVDLFDGPGSPTSAPMPLPVDIRIPAAKAGEVTSEPAVSETGPGPATNSLDKAIEVHEALLAIVEKRLADLRAAKAIVEQPLNPEQLLKELLAKK